jgi:hypothetical protein
MQRGPVGAFFGTDAQLVRIRQRGNIEKEILVILIRRAVLDEFHPA